MTTQYITDDKGSKVAVVIPISDLASIAERRDEEAVFDLGWY
ncbi:MAG: hypothetical protein ACK5LK_09425 [Chthoniobacterales bacterium]